MSALKPLRKPSSDRKAFVGAPIERIEDLRLLRGRGTYVDDITLEGLLHATILRSPIAHGRIRSIDAAAALAMPGVHAVITARDIGEPVPTIPLRLHALTVMEPYRQPVIAQAKVRHVGEPIAIVVADSAAIAEDALAVIELDIEPLPIVPDRHVAARDETLLFEETGSNRPITFHAVKGDAEAAFKRAPYVRSERFQIQRCAAMTMETRGVLAEWNTANNKMTVYGAAKVPFWNRRALAEMLGLPLEAVDLIENDVGGGFGARGEFYTEDFLIPFAARHVGRPVKWIEDRRENLLSMNQAREAEAEIAIACARDGTILGLRGRVYTDLGAYPRTNGLVAPRNSVQFVSGPYRVANIDLHSEVLFTNKTACGTLRAPGRFESNFFCERLLDMAARDLGIDPVEIRRRNLLTDRDMPWPLATCTPSASALASDTECDSGDYRVTFERCLTEFDWAKKRRLQGTLGRWPLSRARARLLYRGRRSRPARDRAHRAQSRWHADDICRVCRLDLGGPGA